MDAPSYTKPARQYGQGTDWAGPGFTVKNEESADPRQENDQAEAA